MPREPRLNATSGLQKFISDQIFQTDKGMKGNFQPFNLQSMGRHIEPTRVVKMKKPIAHKIISMALFTRSSLNPQHCKIKAQTDNGAIPGLTEGKMSAK
jgi:hypothetical protein